MGLALKYATEHNRRCKDQRPRARRENFFDDDED
jgi:hypothetical protein